MKSSRSRLARLRDVAVLAAIVALVASIGLWLALGTNVAAAAPLGTINLFTAGLNPESEPISIVTGPDGNLWFSDVGTAKAIGRIAPSGAISEFSAGLPGNSFIESVVAGPDRDVWFADRGALGRISPAGVITEFSAGLNPGSKPITPVAGSDGNLWFTDFGSTPAIGRITTSGSITEFTAGLSPGGTPGYLALGRDGNLWFIDVGLHAIGRITPGGVISEFTAGLNSGSRPDGGLIAGPDGNMWFADRGSTAAIGRITPSGTIAEFSAGLSQCPTFCGAGVPIAGGDGNVWFPSGEPPSIGRITPSGAITLFNAGLPVFDHPQELSLGREGNIWFVDPSGAERVNNGVIERANAIGRITPGGVISEFSAGLRSCAFGGLPKSLVRGPETNMWFTDCGAIGGITTIEEEGQPAQPPTMTGNPGPTNAVANFGAGSVSSAQIARLLSEELVPSAKAAKVAGLLRAGGFARRVKALEAGTLTIDWYQVPPGARVANKRKAKSVLVAAGKLSFSAAGSATIRIRLTAAGKSLLKHAKKLALIAKGKFTAVGKAPVVVLRKFTLRR